MASLKENLEVQSQGAVLAAQESAYNVKQRFFNLPAWERYLLIVAVALIVPGYFAVRYGTELVMTKQYARDSLSSQPAFEDPDPLQSSKVNIISNPGGSYTAYAVITNPNLDLALPDLRYTFKFFDSTGEQVNAVNGQTYLLPDEEKWVIAPRVNSLANITSGKIEFEEPNWQKRLNLADVELRMSEPYVYEELSPQATVAEGTVVNNSEFNLKQASLVLVLYDKNNKVVAVTQREEYTLQPFERRAYKLSWPGIPRQQVNRIELRAYTNILDESNLFVKSNNEAVLGASE